MIRAVLIGQEHLIPFLREIYPRHRELLEGTVKRLSIRIARHVKEQKLTGQTLKNRTGTLRRSIHYRVESGPTAVYGIVGTNKEYAAAHEYGFQGPVNVKAHLRRIRQAFGIPIPEKEIFVDSHSRQVNLPERSFLRSSLREFEGEIKAGLSETLDKAVRHG